MVTLAYILAFVAVGLALWFVALVAVWKVTDLIGGRLSDQLKLGGEGNLGLAIFTIRGAVIGSVLNGTLGYFAVGNAWSRPDYSFYIVSAAFMACVPLAALTFLFAAGESSLRPLGIANPSTTWRANINLEE